MIKIIFLLTFFLAIILTLAGYDFVRTRHSVLMNTAVN